MQKNPNQEKTDNDAHQGGQPGQNSTKIGDTRMTLMSVL